MLRVKISTQQRAVLDDMESGCILYRSNKVAFLLGGVALSLPTFAALLKKGLIKPKGKQDIYGQPHVLTELAISMTNQKKVVLDVYPASGKNIS